MKTASLTISWRSPTDTLAALHSLASMTTPPDLIICVDNGSSAKQVAELRMGMPKDTVMIELAENLGFAAASNVGMEYALAHEVDWTLFLNNDATADAHCLNRCMAQATTAERIAVVGPAVTFADRPDLLWFAGGEVSDGSPLHAIEDLASPRQTYRPPQTLATCRHAAPWFRRLLGDQLALFDRTTSRTMRIRNGVSEPELPAGGVATSEKFSACTPSARVAVVAEAWA